MLYAEVMNTDINSKRDRNMEPHLDISRRWRRYFNVILTVLSITLLYLVANSGREPIRETDVDGRHQIAAPGFDHQREMRQHIVTAPPILERLKVENEEPSQMPDIENVEIDVPDGPLGDPTLCPTMLEDIEVAPRGSMPLVALASFPRSGNTWTRLLLQVASKLSTGSVYWETEQLYEFNKKTFRAGNEDFQHRTGVCVKTHYYSKDHIDLFPDGAILLLRNPYFSLVSEFFRELVFDGNQTNEDTAKAILKEPRWREGYFPNQSGFWKNTNLNWIKYSKRLMIVFYQDLETNPIYELSRMLKFLKQPIRRDRLACALQLYPPDLKHTYLTFDPFTPDQYESLDGYIAEVNEVLVARHGRPLPKYRYKFQ